MRDRDLYATIFNFQAPWTVADAELDLKGEEVRVRLEVSATTGLCRPQCDRVSGR